MNDTPPEATETEGVTDDAPTPPPADAENRRCFVVLLARDQVEPPKWLTDAEAQAAWAALSAPWHPGLLAVASALPRVEGVEAPSSPGPREVVLIAEGLRDRLPSGIATQAEDVGAELVDALSDRDATVRELLTRFGGIAPEPTEELDVLAVDFLALGTSWWWLRELTAAMGHADAMDREMLAREVLAGALAWSSGDPSTARNRLRAAFEILTQARERFYPVDSYLIDICLVDPAMPAGALKEAMDARAPVTFLAPGKAIEAQASHDPETVGRLREAISEGWADVVGASYDETDEPLKPLESIYWQFRKGADAYRAHLDDRNVETVARRRFALYPMLPQIARRFGLRFAMHMGFDAGRFPVRPEAKRLWESPEHSNLEALTRPPLAADRPATALLLPWRLALTMREDHVATLPLVRWPSPLAPWFLDLRRAHKYSPVLGKSVTLNDYFKNTDRPFEIFGPEPDSYATPYLSQAVAKRDAGPVSSRASHVRLRARLDALSMLKATAEALGTSPAELPPLELAEDALETGDHDAPRDAFDRLGPILAGAVAKGVVGTGTEGRPGYLVINPVGVARRATVLLPDAAADLRPEGPLRASQFTEDGVWAVVELPAFGYAWVPRDTNLEAPPAPSGTMTVKNNVLRNESVSMEIDPATGGIRGVRGVGEGTARIGQQLVINGLVGPDGKPRSSRMVCDGIEVDYGGPALAQAVAKGKLLGPDDAPLASFRQRYRAWAGRPILEIDIELAVLDPGWFGSLAGADPWSKNLSCRWAWPDPNTMVRRTALLSPAVTETDRPETPDAIDISTRRQRTALLFGGLAHHQRHGTRMLDTVLLAGREESRSFSLGVGLDLEHPFHASTDMTAPAFVVPTDAGPPKTGPKGWLYRLDAPSVAVTKVEYVGTSEDGNGWGLAFHLIETAGQAVRGRLRLFRPPTWARQVDFQKSVIVDLAVDGDGVSVDLTPHEILRIEVTLG